MGKKNYLVVGFYSDNGEPFTRTLKSSSALEAAKTALVDSKNPTDLQIVEVFSGITNVVKCLLNEEIMGYVNLDICECPVCGEMFSLDRHGMCPYGCEDEDENEDEEPDFEGMSKDKLVDLARSLYRREDPAKR
jgi:hypothetical protein